MNTSTPFSTLSKKSSEVANPANKFVDPRFKTVMNGDMSATDSVALRNKLTFTDLAKIKFTLMKKGSKFGGNMLREVSVGSNDLLNLKYSKTNKKFAVPAEFYPETKAEFDTKTATGVKTSLAWKPTGQLTGSLYRITFNRKGNNEIPDTAFYFQNPEQFEKAKHYLKCVQLLEKSQTGAEPIGLTLIQKLSQHFKNQVTVKVVIHYKFKQLDERTFIHICKAKAPDVKEEQSKMKIISIILKEGLLAKNRLIPYFDKLLLRSLVEKWKGEAEKRVTDARELARIEKDRNDKLKYSVTNSPMLTKMNGILLRHFLNAWKSESEARIQPDQEDIMIEFSNLELTPQIIQPSIKIEVTVRLNSRIKFEQVSKEYPEIPSINGYPVQTRACEFHLNCKIRNPKNDHVNCWRLVNQRPYGDFFLQEIGKNTFNATNEKFILLFDGYLLQFIEQTEVKIILFDETDTVRAYHYATLKQLYQAAKKGNDIWLCMSINEQNKTKFPLLHLRVRSHYADQQKKMQTLLKPLPKIYNRDYIEDTFFNYRFKIPLITPKDQKFIDLLPDEWNIMDEKTQALHRYGELGEYLQRLKYKFVKHYHKNTSKQLARLKKSAYLWAELQDDLTSYVPHKNEYNNQGFIWVNEEFIKKLPGVQRREFEDMQNAGLLSHPGDYSKIVSYLFKRDQWETKPEWRPFYEKLKHLCHKGISPQHRIAIWSELGRTVYLINLTENHHRKQKGLKYYQQGMLSPEPEETLHQGIENLHQKSKYVYESLKKDCYDEHCYMYQELEDDIHILRKEMEAEKIPFEKNVRNICRTFIYWCRMFSENVTEEQIRYFVSYSRSFLRICIGLVTSQNCKYFEVDSTVEEDQIFWLLISISTYIIACYFESNENSLSIESLTTKRDKNTQNKKAGITNSALKCPYVRGIKSDLLVLKMLLHEKEIEIYNKFDELGLPLEYYFSDHMTSLFVNLFNPGLVFRIWDLIFFEGSGSNHAQCNKLIIGIIFQILRDCKPMILKAKKSTDIPLILSIYCKFQTKYGTFIDEVYRVIETHLDQRIPQVGNVLDKLSYIRYAIFSDQHSRVDKKLQTIEKIIEDHQTYIYEQNLIMFALANGKYSYKEGEQTVMTYSMLSKIIKDCNSLIGAQKTNTTTKTDPIQSRSKVSFVEADLSQRFVKDRISNVFFKIHRMSIYWTDLDHLAMYITYGKDRVQKKEIHSNNLNFEGEFILKNTKDVPRFVMLEVFDEGDPTNPIKIKSVEIDLKVVQMNCLTKMVLKLNEEINDVPVENFTTSEVEISILLTGTVPIPDPKFLRVPRTLFITDFENVSKRSLFKLKQTSYKVFRNMNLENVFRGETRYSVTNNNGLDDPLVSDSYSYTFFSKNRHAWKQNFIMSYEDFLVLIKKIAPFWVGNADFQRIYAFIARANENQIFYLNDFFTLLILFGKFTLNQKLSLIFDLLTGFDEGFVDKTQEVPYYMMKGLLSYLFQTYMIYVPFNELENLLDLSCYGYTSSIKRVVINGNDETKIEYPRLILNRLINYLHLAYQMKEIHLYHQEILDLLRDIYVNELSSGKIFNRNKVEITYYCNSMTHKVKLEMDQNWRLLDNNVDYLTSQKTISVLLGRFQYVISLQNSNKVFDKQAFIDIFQKIPLLNYLNAFENIEAGSCLHSLQHNIKYRVVMGGETVINYTLQIPEINLNMVGESQQRKGKKRRLHQLLRDWEDIAMRVTLRNQSGNVGTLGKPRGVKYLIEDKRLSIQKGDIYLNYENLMKIIKKSIMKTLINEINSSLQNADRLSPAIFHENLWNLEYKANLITNNKDFEIQNLGISSPFSSLMEVARDFPLDQKDIKSAEIVFTIKPSANAERMTEHFDQLGLYRYSDSSTDWLKCRLKYKFQYEPDLVQISPIPHPASTQIDGFGVVFEKFPKEIILKRGFEIAMLQKVDINDLDFKQKRVQFTPTFDHQRTTYRDSARKTIQNRSPSPQKTAENKSASQSPLRNLIVPFQAATMMPTNIFKSRDLNQQRGSIQKQSIGNETQSPIKLGGFQTPERFSINPMKTAENKPMNVDDFTGQVRTRNIQSSFKQKAQIKNFVDTFLFSQILYTLYINNLNHLMALSTQLTKLFKIKHPIILAPMALVTGGKLAAAVQKAGGLGIIGGAYCDPVFLRTELEKAEGTNPAIGFITWKLNSSPEVMDIAINANPPAIFFSFGDFSNYVKPLKDKGIKIIAQVQTLSQAVEAAQQGADVIVAQGTEAGGHGGNRSTMPFVPAVRDAVHPIPVVAAGGIADGRGLAAALMLGADGVVMGSRFYASKESLAGEDHKNALIKSKGDDSIRNRIMDELRKLDWPKEYSFRVIRNQYMEKCMKDEIKWRNNEEQSKKLTAAIKDWKIDTWPVVSGEAVDLIKDIPSANEIVEKTVEEARNILLDTKKFIGQRVIRDCK